MNTSMKKVRPLKSQKKKITKYNVYQTDLAGKSIDPKFLIRWRKKIEGVVDTSQIEEMEKRKQVRMKNLHSNLLTVNT